MARTFHSNNWKFCVLFLLQFIGKLFYWAFWERIQKTSVTNAMYIDFDVAKSIQLHLTLNRCSTNKFVLELPFKNFMFYHLTKSQILQIKWPQTSNYIDQIYILAKVNVKFRKRSDKIKVYFPGTKHKGRAIFVQC